MNLARIYIEKVADGIGTKGNSAHEVLELHVYVGSIKSPVKVADIKISYPLASLEPVVEVDGKVVKKGFIAILEKDYQKELKLERSKKV